MGQALLLALVHVAKAIVVDNETTGDLLAVSNKNNVVLGDRVIDRLLHLDLETIARLRAMAARAIEGLEALQGGGVCPLGSSPMAKDGGLHHCVSLACSLYHA